jgi:hypothetical protein
MRRNREGNCCDQGALFAEHGLGKCLSAKPAWGEAHGNGRRPCPIGFAGVEAGAMAIVKFDAVVLF